MYYIMHTPLSKNDTRTRYAAEAYVFIVCVDDYTQALQIYDKLLVDAQAKKFTTEVSNRDRKMIEKYWIKIGADISVPLDCQTILARVKQMDYVYRGRLKSFFDSYGNCRVDREEYSSILLVKSMN